MAAGLLRELLPPQIAVEEAFGDPPDTVLFPEESAAIAGAVDKRRREFTGGRFCARAALRRLGLPAVSVPPGPKGAPSWPDGVVGSITHCEGYCAGAATSAPQILTIGIDAEPAAALPDGVIDAVALPDERDALRALDARWPQVPWDRLLFSAKESVYKAWFPLTGVWLGFDQARLAFQVGPGEQRRGSFTVELLRSAPATARPPRSPWRGRWIVGRGLVATAIAPTGSRSAQAR